MLKKRCGIIFLGAVSFLCLFFLLPVNQKPATYNQQRVFESLHDYEAAHNFTNVSIRHVVQQYRAILEQALNDYDFPPNTNLKNFTLATGGRPLRNIIITTWRSGSTFLGDVINSLPGNFYHYEPLLDYGIEQIRGPPYADSALRNLKRLLMCEYKDLRRYLAFGRTNVYLFTHNVRLWNQCEIYPQYCWNATFLSEFCKLFPFQSMKVVRLRLRLTEELLKDETLNVKVLLLVRDPRGTMQSRKHRDFCLGNPDCDDPSLLCADLVSDYSAATRLQKLYPTRFRAMRYEDLSLDPYRHTAELLNFFGLKFHPKVLMFLDSHTKQDIGGVSSTFRNSKTAPFHWRLDLNYSEVQYIEENCDEAMKLWGYVRAENELHLREFHPLANYTIS